MIHSSLFDSLIQYFRSQKFLFQFQDVVSKLREFKNLCRAYKDLRTTKLKLGGCCFECNAEFSGLVYICICVDLMKEKKNYSRFNSEKSYHL